MEESVQSLILKKLEHIESMLTTCMGDISDMKGRVLVLENDMKDVVGNGHLGRLTIVEKKVTSLIQWKYWFLGVSGATAIFLSFIYKCIFTFIK